MNYPSPWTLFWISLFLLGAASIAFGYWEGVFHHHWLSFAIFVILGAALLLLSTAELFPF